MSDAYGERIVNNACAQGAHSVCRSKADSTVTLSAQDNHGITVHDAPGWGFGRVVLCECECHGLPGAWLTSRRGG